MKNIRIVLLFVTLVIIGVLATSCSSSKSSTYPKRLQRSVKCSGCKRSETVKNDNKTTVVAYHQLSHSPVSK
ncbi:MAG: hypothetical protein LBL90_10560 [Prevotellaceae bacterium]|jgi:hypothetical protein|nr:hypothetical protein [Prevotellaceae bacterium]